MKNLRLIPDIHRHEPIVKAGFAYDRELIVLLQSQKGARWSQTLQSWYFPKKEFLLSTFYELEGNENCEVIGSIVDYIFAFETPDLAIDRMAHADTKIVSLTITEVGYNFNPNTGAFDFDNPDIQHDLQYPNNPKTVFGYLAAALEKRRNNGLVAFTILSCDNIQHNGAVTRSMFLSFVEKKNPSLYNWIKDEVSSKLYGRQNNTSYPPNPQLIS